MSYLFIIWTAATGLLSPILCFLRARKYVLYTFVLFGVLAPLVWGYMDAANLLVGGKLWSILDVQFVLLVLIAYPLSRRGVTARAFSWMDVAMFILTSLIVLNFFVGYLRLGSLSGVLNITRRFMSVPVYFVAANILSDPKNVRKFYRWIMWFTIPLLAIHLLIALRIYLPPLYQARLELAILWQRTDIARSTLYFYEPFYVVAACVAISYLLYGHSGKFLALVALLCSGIGALLTQTRSIYGGMFLVFLGVIGLAKGRIKGLIASVVVLAALFAVVEVAREAGVDFLYRFRGEKLRHAGYAGNVRANEFVSLAESFKETPLALMTGQGFGVMHQLRRARNPRGYFHNDYLGSLFSLGVIGFVCFCYVMFSCIFRGHRYCKDPEMALLLMPVRLIFFSVAGMAIFNQMWWYYKGTALIVVIAAISRNSDYFADQIYGTEELLSEEGIEITAAGQLVDV